MKGKEPIIIKKIRNLFMKRTYETYLINEFNTSKIWKLVRCKICKSIHNRDHNATKNMMKKTNSILSLMEPSTKIYKNIKAIRIFRKIAMPLLEK